MRDWRSRRKRKSQSARRLRELEYRVLEAHDGPSALRLLEQEQHICLLFTDVVLPGGMTGAQVAAQAGLTPTVESTFHDGVRAQCYRTSRSSRFRGPAYYEAFHIRRVGRESARRSRQGDIGGCRSVGSPPICSRATTGG